MSVGALARRGVDGAGPGARGSPFGLEPKRAFRALYRALSGQDHGPRFGPFVKLVGQEAARSALQRAVGASD